jgi:hypothetical protein
MMVIDTVEEIAPGVIEVDEYVVEADNGGTGQDARPDIEGEGE